MIRPASLADVSAICQLTREELGYEAAEDLVRQQLTKMLHDESHLVFVAVEKTSQKVVGYAYAAPYDCLYFEPLLNLLALPVSENNRRQGHARALMGKLADIAAEKGLAGIRINSGIGRLGAHAFYRSLACAEKADQKRFFLKVGKDHEGNN